MLPTSTSFQIEHLTIILSVDAIRMNIFVIFLRGTRLAKPLLIMRQFYCKMHDTTQYCGARGGAVGWGTALQVGRSRVRFPMVSLKFFIAIILPAALWPWGWLSFYQKWVFPEGKGGRCLGLTNLPLSCADCLEIWEPNPPANMWVCPGLYMYCFNLAFISNAVDCAKTVACMQ